MMGAIDDDASQPVDSEDEVSDTAVVSVSPASGLSPAVILLDSAATHAVTPNICDLVDVVVSPIKKITGVSGCKDVRIHQGTMQVCGVLINNVLCVPAAKNKIIPVRVIVQMFGGDVAMSVHNSRHFAPNGHITVLGPCLPQGLYSIETLPDPVLLVSASIYALSTANQLKRERLLTLHKRLGHCSKRL